MPEDDRALTSVASAILNGTPVDWEAAEDSAEGDDRPLLEELRLLSSVADLHRRLAAADQQQAAPVDDEPRTWGRLRLLERVGGGTFGDVYRAWDPRLDRAVALKLITTREGSDLRTAAVLHEGRLLARVRHPGVVTIYDAERMGSQVGLSMEFVEGSTLEQRIAQQGAFDPPDAIEIGVQLCDALAAVHGAGVLHRDVKAANVVIRTDGRVVLMDFGAGRQLDDAFPDAATGTPLYVAPEVLEGREATVRSDVYSVGVLLHHVLTGAYPVQARTLAELREAHQRRTRDGGTDLRASHPHIPARLARLVERATDPSPERRHESAAALAADLRTLRPQSGARGWAVALALLAVAATLTGAGWLAGPGGADWLSRRAGSVPSSGEPLRIAILPFAWTGDGPTDDGLRDTMTRDLIAGLQGFENARVISTASVFSIGALNLPLAEAAARLGVSTALTGSIARAGGTVRVEARLVAVPGERTIWSGTYARSEDDRNAIAEAIAQDVARSLALRPTGPFGRAGPGANLEAHALYVRGRSSLDQYTNEGMRLALRLFEEALRLDPDLAVAHAGLAMLYLQSNPGIPGVSGEEAVGRATEAAGRALALDPSLPSAYAASAGVRSTMADWAGAERDYLQAIALGPSDVLVRQQYAQWLALLGRFDEAVAQARVAESLDPLSPRAVMALASAFRFARRFEEAIPQTMKALDLDPNYRAAYLNLGHCYQGLGRLEEAIAAFERSATNLTLRGNLGHAYAQAGRERDARAIIARLEQQYAETGLGSGSIAQVYSGLGEIDRAFEWIDRMDRYHTPWPTTFKVALVWDPLRGDPRWQEVLRRYGLVE